MRLQNGNVRPQNEPTTKIIPKQGILVFINIGIYIYMRKCICMHICIYIYYMYICMYIDEYMCIYKYLNT